MLTADYVEENKALSEERGPGQHNRPQHEQTVVEGDRRDGQKVRQGPLGDSRRGSYRSAFAGLLAFALSLPLVAGDLSSQAKTIHYHEDGDIPHVYIHAGYSTELVFDDKETVVRVAISNAFFSNSSLANKVVLFATGDEPGKGADVRVFMASNNEYTFLLKEVTREATEADLRIRVKGESKEFQDAQVAPPKLFTADQVQEIKNQLSVQKETNKRDEEKAARQIAIAATKEVSVLHHDYEIYGRKGEQLKVTPYHDDKFTYVECECSEAPVLSEVKDGHYSAIDAPFINGKFTVEKILDNGVLTIGKSEVKFKRIGGNS